MRRLITDVSDFNNITVSNEASAANQVHGRMSNIHQYKSLPVNKSNLPKFECQSKYYQINPVP